MRLLEQHRLAQILSRDTARWWVKFVYTYAATFSCFNLYVYFSPECTVKTKKIKEKGLVALIDLVFHQSSALQHF